MRSLALVSGIFVLTACSGVEDLLGVDSGHVQFSCAASGPLATTPPLQSSLDALVPGVEVEVRRQLPQGMALITMPAGSAGDNFTYSWQEGVTGQARPPGVWLCEAGWRFDGRAWRLTRFDVHWLGAAVEQK